MLREVVKRSSPFSSNIKLLVLGAGFSGLHIANAAKALGAKVLCSRRNSNHPGSDFAFNSEEQLFPLKNILEGTTHLISCIPPNSEGKDPVISSLQKQLQEIPLKWVGYLSTTGVYGDCGGNWVTEQKLANPQQLRSKKRLACEEAWLNSGLPAQILRLPGIYGPGRSAIETILSGKSKMVQKYGQVFSRIHIDDIAGAVIHLINLAATGQSPTIINVADNMPTANIEVLTYAAKILNYPLPEIEDFESAAKKMSPMALSFWQENRKVSNQLLCEELGYSLIHPNYMSGLKDCLKHVK